MTPKQAEQMDRMHRTLERIAKQYQTPAQLQRASEKKWGIEYCEALEMAYENIQTEAKAAIKGVRLPKGEKP